MRYLIFALLFIGCNEKDVATSVAVDDNKWVNDVWTYTASTKNTWDLSALVLDGGTYEAYYYINNVLFETCQVKLVYGVKNIGEIIIDNCVDVLNDPSGNVYNWEYRIEDSVMSIDTVPGGGYNVMAIYY